MDPTTTAVGIIVNAAGELLALLVAWLVVRCRRADRATDQRDRP